MIYKTLIIIMILITAFICGINIYDSIQIGDNVESTIIINGMSFKNIDNHCNSGCTMSLVPIWTGELE